LSGAIAPKKKDERVMRGGDMFANIMSEFDGKAGRFEREVSSGDFPVSSSYSGHCQDCGYDKVCRTRYRIK